MAEDCAASALLVHGAGGGGWEWNAWRGVLAAAGFAVASPDLQAARGGLAATTLDDYRAQVQRALQGLPRPRVAVGASLGGLLVAMASDAADALVLVNPLPPAPLHARLTEVDHPDVVPWRSAGRMESTRRALPDADGNTLLYAFRRWRDESGVALRSARAGIVVRRPGVPVLCIASCVDTEVPPAVTAALAAAWDASLLHSPALSHVGPLLGRSAHADARAVAAWCRLICRPDERNPTR